MHLPEPQEAKHMIPGRHSRFSRRSFMRQSASWAVVGAFPLSASGQTRNITLRPIPSSKQLIPAIGMGSWLTFDIHPSGSALKTRIEILKTFFDGGGQLIDSSPMYGQSEAVIGECLQALKYPSNLFSATKVWTTGKEQGIRQMRQSALLWKAKQFNLMQIHNLVDWKQHIATLMDWKEKGALQYVGITTYGGLRHEELKNIIKNYPLDFIQLTYNIVDREAEVDVLPLAQERGVAVIANRPFKEGRLFNYIANKPLPSWAREYDCNNWAQYFLKFILANPAITCAIPATSQVAHMQENIAALKGNVPNLDDQKKMAKYFNSIG